MTARNGPKPGWVTVAAAAAALTEGGDPIDASNVSRYLARNPDIPQEKPGKFRFVDLAALKAHRSSSIFVHDKREARSLAPLPSASAASPPAEGDETATAREPTALQLGKLELQQFDLRKRRREEALEEGRLVPAEDLQTVVSAMMTAMTAELARQEQGFTLKFGAEAGVAFRKAVREARTKAAARLKAEARQSLHPNAAEQLTADGADGVEAA